jgi:hypothetical protein
MAPSFFLIERVLPQHTERICCPLKSHFYISENFCCIFYSVLFLAVLTGFSFEDRIHFLNLFMDLGNFAA